MIRCKSDTLEKLKSAGYSQYTLGKNKLICERQLDNLRNGRQISVGVIDTVCRLLQCQPGEVLEYIADAE